MVEISKSGSGEGPGLGNWSGLLHKRYPAYELYSIILLSPDLTYSLYGDRLGILYGYR
jgi:hypothetical protein